ncbi:hypothetical protein C8Q80DRAFT_1266778 [Daedaleopsis nitida]|nr:hypothetical protein C8Q80DRAFT_1266778 [Daedaleopsis nitida]
MHCRLVTADISLSEYFIEYPVVDAEQPQNLNPGGFLAHSHSTLRSLWVHSVSAAPNPPTCFSCLTSLTLYFSSDVFCTTTLVKAYPKLEELTVSDCLDLFEDTADWSRVRAENVRDQMQMGSWRFLSLYDGTISSLYFLGLTCHVSTLNLYDSKFEDYGPGPANAQMFRQVLRDARPSHLESFLNENWTYLLDSDFVSFFANVELKSWVLIWAVPDDLQVP